MLNSFFEVMSYVVQPQHYNTFMALLRTYVDRTASAALRKAAYRSLWSFVARGIASVPSRIFLAFAQPALSAAGASTTFVAGVMARLATGFITFLTGTAGLYLLIALLILILLYLLWQWYQSVVQQNQQKQRQQNEQLQRSTERLFNSVPFAPYAALANHPEYGPMKVIESGELQPCLNAA